MGKPIQPPMNNDERIEQELIKLESFVDKYQAIVLREIELEGALKHLCDVIDAAGLDNLTRGVQLGPTVWYVKATGALIRARAVLVKD